MSFERLQQIDNEIEKLEKLASHTRKVEIQLRCEESVRKLLIEHTLIRQEMER